MPWRLTWWKVLLKLIDVLLSKRSSRPSWLWIFMQPAVIKLLNVFNSFRVISRQDILRASFLSLFCRLVDDAFITHALKKCSRFLVNLESCSTSHNKYLLYQRPLRIKHFHYSYFSILKESRHDGDSCWLESFSQNAMYVTTSSINSWISHINFYWFLHFATYFVRFKPHLFLLPFL